MASPALIVKPTAGFVQVPSSFVENQGAFIPAERALALTLFRRVTDERTGKTNLNGTATISDRTWEKWTGLQPRMKELAIKGLREKGLQVEGRGDTAKFSWHWDTWNEALQTPRPSNYDPNRRARDAKAAAQKVHPDCATGCAKLREAHDADKLTTPFLVTEIAQPVARTAAVPTPETPKPAAPKTGSLAEKEVTWKLTLGAMRTHFASAGVDLLVRLLAVLVSFMKLNLSDYVLAEAVKVAYAESRGRWNSPVLLLKTVPDVLAGWKAKGQPMDDTGEDETAPRVWKKPLEDSRILPGTERAQQSINNMRRILNAAKRPQE